MYRKVPSQIVKRDALLPSVNISDYVNPISIEDKGNVNGIDYLIKASDSDNVYSDELPQLFPEVCDGCLSAEDFLYVAAGPFNNGLDVRESTNSPEENNNCPLSIDAAVGMKTIGKMHKSKEEDGSRAADAVEKILHPETYGVFDVTTTEARNLSDLDWLTNNNSPAATHGETEDCEIMENDVHAQIDYDSIITSQLATKEVIAPHEIDQQVNTFLDVNYNIIKTEIMDEDETAEQPLSDGSVLKDEDTTIQPTYKVLLDGQSLSIEVPSTIGQKHGKFYDDPHVCGVCGDPKPQGTSYGVVSCEGCKGFFKRIIQGEQKVPCNVSECPSKGNCVIDKFSRTKCRYCRLKACLMAGMNARMVLHPKYRISQRNIDDYGEKRGNNNQTAKLTAKRSHEKISESVHENHTKLNAIKIESNAGKNQDVNRGYVKESTIGRELKQIMKFEKKGVAVLASKLVGIENTECIVTLPEDSIWILRTVIHYTDLLAVSAKYPMDGNDGLLIKENADVDDIRRTAHLLLQKTVNSILKLPLFENLRTKVKIGRIVRIWPKILILSMIEYDSNLAVCHGIRSAFKEAKLQSKCYQWMFKSVEYFSKEIGNSGQVLSSVTNFIKFLKPSKVELLILKLMVIFSPEGFLIYGINTASEIEIIREVLLGFLYKNRPVERAASIMDGLSRLMSVTESDVVRIFYPAKSCFDMENIIHAYCTHVLSNN